MALDLGGEASRSGVVSGSPASALPATSPPTVAAADEPEPARERDPVEHRDAPARRRRQLAARGLERRLEAPHEPVLAVRRQLAGALALDRQLDLAATPAADLELDPVGQREREPRQS